MAYLGDGVPVGVECFYQQNSSHVPFNSMYDYESWSQGSNRCYIAITFYGKDRQRDYPIRARFYNTPGFYDEYSDDLVLSLGTHNLPCQ